MLQEKEITLDNLKPFFKECFTELKEGTKVQESASDIMKFLIQDLLDYA